MKKYYHSRTIWINPIIDEIGNFIKSYFKSKSKEQ